MPIVSKRKRNAVSENGGQTSCEKAYNVIPFPLSENIKCMLCTEENNELKKTVFKDLRSLWRHASKYHTSYLHVMMCNHCGCEYNDVSKAAAHAKKLSNGELKLQTLPSYAQKQKSTNSISIPFPFAKEMCCPVCSDGSVLKPSFWNLISHITRIHKDVSFYIECRQCTYKTEDVADMRIHYQTCQLSVSAELKSKTEESSLVFRYPFEEGFHCDMCQKSGTQDKYDLLNYRDFRRHIGKKHADVDIQFVCCLCEYASKDLTVLKLHYVRCKDAHEQCSDTT